MAIFNTEKVKLNGGAILANNAANSKLTVDSGGGAKVIALDEDVATLSSAKDTVSTAVLTESSARASAITTLSNAKDTVSSGMKSNSTNIATLSTTVSNLDNESEVGTQAIGNNKASQVITFSQSFSEAPKVMGMLRNSQDEPILAAQLSGINATTATFIFSDETPSANYTLDYIASL